MNNNLNIITASPKWNNCDFDINKTAKIIFDTVLNFVRQQEETDFLNSGQDIIVNLSLSYDEEIHKLNKEFRNIDKPTNVLSFANIDDDDFDNYIKLCSEIELGDIIISYETLSKEATEKNITIHDHFSHLLTHGILHLLGFDHQDDDEAEYMEDFEIKILQQFNIKNPYEE